MGCRASEEKFNVHILFICALKLDKNYWFSALNSYQRTLTTEREFRDGNFEFDY